MNIIKFFIRSCCRLSLKRTSCLHSIRRRIAAIIFIFVFFSFFILFFYSVLILYLNYYYYGSSNIIVSLTTTPVRFQYELPFAIHSLLAQTKLPKEIRIYLSPTASISNQTNVTLKSLKLYIKQLDSSTIISKLFDKIVQIHFEEEDYGPATKFLPIIKNFHSITTNISKSQAIMICDDDHYYHPHTVATLIKYSDKYKNSIIGLRGWRIREDRTWGVSKDEISHHIIESFRLSQMYRVGIVTANYAYLIRPSFFDSHIYLDFNQAPADVRRVDDIWLNGQASKRDISRFVVPSCCPSIGVTRTHELENYLIAHQMTRSSANDHALKWFSQAWEKDLWYRFKGENQPRYHSWLFRIYRNWIRIILRSNSKPSLLSSITTSMVPAPLRLRVSQNK